MIEHKNIHEALNAVMGEVGYVQKQKAKQLNYSYAGEAALIAAIRPRLVEHGIYVHPQELQTVNQDTYSTSKGTFMNRTTVVMVYRFEHVTGSFIDVPAVGEGADVGDKSASKASTGAYKYALRQALMIETGDDPDDFSSDGPPPATQASNGHKSIMSWEKFLDYCVANVDRYDSTHGVIGAFNLLNVKPTDDPDLRRQAFEMLKVYADNRNAGRDKEAALMAVITKVG